ncbi:MAG: response regulator transcription factor [Pseudomonadota bacterium]
MVEDHPLFADAVELTLEGGLGVREMRRASTLAEAFSALDGGFRPETVLLDLGLPDAYGLEGLARMRAAAPSAFVIIVTSYAEPRVATAALLGGADGVILKTSGREALADGVRRVWAGERVAPADVLLRFDGDRVEDPEAVADAEAARRLSTLTAQQSRILDLVCQGMLNKQIAFELDIAETTVKAHISAILRKLGVQSRTQAVLAAQKVRFSRMAQTGPAGI